MSSVSEIEIRVQNFLRHEYPEIIFPVFKSVSVVKVDAIQVCYIHNADAAPSKEDVRRKLCAAFEGYHFGIPTITRRVPAPR